MKIGLIDVDGHRYPNIPLMKISAFHKKNGDIVGWYDPKSSIHLDRVYMSKVFSFTPDYQYKVMADKVIKGGSGYAIRNEDGREVYVSEKDKNLPYEVEHIYPDYSLYPDMTADTAYGFLTRGCPRGCSFCHVAVKEGRCSVRVADLSEFWRGQKKIVLCDPNLLACKDSSELLEQLAESKAMVNFNQGLDIRLVNDENICLLRNIRIDSVHFAFDRYEDWNVVVPKMKMVKEETGWNRNRGRPGVYILVNYDTTIEQDLERIYLCRSLEWTPYIMIYNKRVFFDKRGRLRPLEELLKEHTAEEIEHIKVCQRMQRWCNNFIFWKVPRFEDYDPRSYRRKVRS